MAAAHTPRASTLELATTSVYNGQLVQPRSEIPNLPMISFNTTMPVSVFSSVSASDSQCPAPLDLSLSRTISNNSSALAFSGNDSRADSDIRSPGSSEVSVSSDSLVRSVHVSTSASLPAPVLVPCPVCCDYMVKPIYQCINGHSVCSFCRESTPVCAFCRTTQGRVRNLTLEALAGDQLLPCRYAYLGCNMSVKPDDWTAHVISCDHRETVNLARASSPATSVSSAASFLTASSPRVRLTSESSSDSEQDPLFPY